MTWIMGDSTTLTDIPLSVAVAATYGTGQYAVSAAAVEKRFPHAKYGWNRIDTTGQQPGLCDTRDWETGDKAGSLEQWVIDHNHARGAGTAVVYCNRSTIPEVRTLTRSQVLGRDYWLWVATLDGTVFGPSQYAGVVACQVKGQALTGGHWDMSVVFDGSLWRPVAPPKAPPSLVSASVTFKLSDGTTKELSYP